jgi:hypothetical protein
LNVSEEDSPKDIKKKYREQALLWHPDKNREPEATEKFQRIQEAYQYLMKSADDPVEIESYRTMLFAFIRDNLPDGIDSEKFVYVIEIILNRLKRICENNAISFFDNINIELLTRIYNILLSYKEIFHLSDDFILQIKDVLDKKVYKKSQIEVETETETVIIHPTVDDLFENNLYKIVRGEQTFLIPLWHHELLYDMSGVDLVVKCFPILPEGITIDENNNIEMNITWEVNEIWDKTNLFIHIGCNTFCILREQLLLKEYQIVKLYRNGISKIDTKNVYNVSEKGDIILHIHLILSEKSSL